MINLDNKETIIRIILWLLFGMFMIFAGLFFYGKCSELTVALIGLLFSIILYISVINMRVYPF